MRIKPLGQKEFIALFALVTSMTALSIDTMLPALDTIGRDLGVSDPRDVQYIISLLVLGMMAGELFFGSLADALGRKKALMVGLLIYGAGTIMTLAAQSMTMLLVGRVVQGIGVAGPKIASRALLRDQFEGDALARISSIIFMIFILVPMVAPLVGMLLVNLWHWRAIFLVFLLLAIINGLWLGLRQPETLPPERRIALQWNVQLANILSIMKIKSVVALTLALGCVFGTMLSYISTAPAIFHDIYGITDLFPLYFAMLAGGIGVSSFLNAHVVRRFGATRMALGALIAATALSAMGMLGVVHGGGVLPFPLFMVLFFSLFFCLGALFGNLSAIAMQPLGNMAGIGASFISAFSSLTSALIAMLSGRFYDGTLFAITICMLLAFSTALTLFFYSRKVKVHS